MCQAVADTSIIETDMNQMGSRMFKASEHHIYAVLEFGSFLALYQYVVQYVLIYAFAYAMISTSTTGPF